jgi:hypothetical protein
LDWDIDEDTEWHRIIEVMDMDKIFWERKLRREETRSGR